MRFVSVLGVLARARRFVSSIGSIDRESVMDAARLAEAISSLQARVSRMEAAVGPEATEFEVDCVNLGTVRMRHEFGCPVRWYVTHWVGAAAAGLSRNSTSTDDELVLDCYSTGRAIVRIEPSQFGVS